MATSLTTRQRADPVPPISMAEVSPRTTRPANTQSVAAKPRLGTRIPSRPGAVLPTVTVAPGYATMAFGSPGWPLVSMDSDAP